MLEDFNSYSQTLCFATCGDAYRRAIKKKLAELPARPSSAFVVEQVVPKNAWLFFLVRLSLSG
jgi:hypothetical protein